MPKSKLIISWLIPDNGVVIKGPVVIDTDMTDIDDVSNEDNELHPDVIAGIKNTGVEDFSDEIKDGEFDYDSSCHTNGIQVGFYVSASYQIYTVLIPGDKIN